MLFRVFTLLAVIALAVSTWIISSPGHAPTPLKNIREIATPGYYLKNTILTDYNLNGSPSVRIVADQIDQIAHSNEVTMRHVRVDYQTESGTTWIMTGEAAHIEPGGNVVDVSGDVRLTNQSTTGAARGALDRADLGDPTVMRTDHLSYNITEALASTPSDVRIEFGKQTLTARGFSANLKAHTLRMESQVHGLFRP